jgi:hypothetical protein
MSELQRRFGLNWESWFPEIDLFSEWRFMPPRRFRFDFAHPESRVAIEIQGAIWVNGRHSRGSGLLKEHEKLNLAAAQGWRVFFLSVNTINDHSLYDQIAQTITSTSNLWTPFLRPRETPSFTEPTAAAGKIPVAASPGQSPSIARSRG